MPPSFSADPYSPPAKRIPAVLARAATRNLLKSESTSPSPFPAYNVKVIFFDAGNQIATHNFTPSELGWIGECVHTSFPCKAGFRLYATPKSDLSGVAEDEKFNIDGTFKFTIVGKYSDGTTENLELKEEGIAYTGLRPYNGRVIKSLRFAYQIDQNGKKEAIEIEE